MAPAASNNYLRVHRKQSGLSQQEVAAILGCEDHGAISRYESAHHLPPLILALGFEVLFLVPVSGLFCGLREEVGRVVEERLLKLEEDLGARSAKGPHAGATAKKLLWLMERRSTDSTA